MTRVYAPENDYVPSDDVLHLVNLDRSGQPFMPRLQLLNWTTSRAFLPWLHLLLSPSLSDIHVDLNGGRATPVNVAVVKALPTVQLKHVAFSTVHTNTELDDALLGLVLEAKRLESIYIQQEMNTEDTSPPSDEIEDEREPITLEYLTSIIIGFKTETAFLQNLFNGRSLPKIQLIYLKHLGKTEWVGADDLFDSMLLSASPNVLHTLRYTSHYHGMDITSARIQPLQSFTVLRTLRVTSSCSTTRCKFFLSDDDVSTVALAMPNLAELYLGGPPCNSTLVNVSVDGLAALATNCTKLTELQIHFDTAGFISKALDTTNEHVAPAQSTQDPCQLAQLNVGRIPLNKGTDGYWTVAMALLRLFPNLKSIKSHQQMFAASDWGEVMRIIKVQRNVASLLSGALKEPILTRVVSNTLIAGLILQDDCHTGE
jgi:hypothetical protein